MSMDKYGVESKCPNCRTGHMIVQYTGPGNSAEFIKKAADPKITITAEDKEIHECDICGFRVIKVRSLE